jgi:hypothetical protein
MNVRVQPTVRCAFVPEENALKFILMENAESPSADSPAEVKQELVIYVLKVCAYQLLTYPLLNLVFL